MPRLIALLCACLLAACASPQVQAPGHAGAAPRLAKDAAIMADGYRLPMRRWGNPELARGLVLALHGFNDYSNAFAGLGDFLGQRGLLVYAYDQRGFGTTAQRGLWPGKDLLVADLLALVRLLGSAHPDLPLFVLGESMGGAAILAAGPRLDGIAGAVLIAPALWGRSTMPRAQRLALDAAAHSVPGLRLTGRGLGLKPTDNIPLWRAYSADPLVIKGTRVDALWGLANLMDLGSEAAREWSVPTLILYGAHDEIVPPRALCATLDLIPGPAPARLVLYRRGWHMLTRDLQGVWPMADIAAWIEDPCGPLPSGEETRPDGERIAKLCAP